MKIPKLLYVGAVCIMALIIYGASQPTITIYTIGDSTMSHYDSTKDLRVGWADRLKYYFNSSAVIEDDARSGRSSKSFIDEGLWTAVINKVQAGDYVFIQFGHNDEKTTTSLHTDPYTTYIQNLAKFVTETRAKGATPILFTPICRRNFGSDGILKDTHGDYPPAMRHLADSLGVLLVDMTVKTTVLVQSYGPDSSKKIYNYVDAGVSSIYPSGNTDDTHINSFGAYLFAGLAVQGIREQNMDLAAYLSPLSDVTESAAQKPEAFGLGRNYPNPFNPSTTISYTITRPAHIMLKVYTMLGKEVASLVNEQKTAGSYRVNFNAANLPSGIYCYSLSDGINQKVQKMILMK